MKFKYSALQINAYMTVTSSTQCACPVRVCGSIIDLRELHDHQLSCMTDAMGDQKTHGVIARATQEAHAILEDCLTEILKIEGIDPCMLPIPSV